MSSVPRRLARGALAVSLLCVAAAAQADVFRPAYLELRERGEGAYDVLWKVPARGDGMRLAASVRFPEGTALRTPPRGHFEGGAYVERWTVERPGGLVGETVSIDGITSGVTDVLVRVERQDGTSQVERLLPTRPAFTVLPPAGLGEVAWSYLVLGVEHILGGVDHLLFVLALLLIVRGGWRDLSRRSRPSRSRTASRSRLATLGLVPVPQPPVEAVIALSIVFVAAETVHAPARPARAHGARTVDRGVQLRAAARPRLRGRALGGGAPADGDPARAALLQRRGRARAARLRRRGAGRSARFWSASGSSPRAGCSGSRPTPSAASRCSGCSSA